MLKVLWYVNIAMPAAAEQLQLKGSPGGGWLVGQAKALSCSAVQLTVLNVTSAVKKETQCTVDDIQYVFFPARADYVRLYRQLLQTSAYDLVHIWGTEYPYNTDLAAECRKLPLPYVISLQGIMSEYAMHFFDGLPQRFQRVNRALRIMKTLYYSESIALQQQAFAAQGKREVHALQNAAHVIGRTEWDKQFSLRTNPQINYHKVNENLRDAFYTGERWAYDRCEKHSVFISQAFYPIKGFHQFIKAIPALAEKYPDFRVYVAGATGYSLGNKLLDKGVDFFFEYQAYIKRLIRTSGVADCIVFLGPQNTACMKRQYLKCNVFVSPSAIENSPNSVCEAMMLGIPVVASDVGGTGSLLRDGHDGLLYPFADQEALTERICHIFDRPDFASTLGEHAKATAAERHNPRTNTQALLQCYRQLGGAE